MFEKNPKLSIVIPVLNEEDNIEILNERIKDALAGKIDYEVIWIDDGSTDTTPKILEKISKNNIHSIILMARTGQSGALMAGIDAAKGEYIATMDGDNQDDPADFLKMIEKLEKEDLDVVVGWRQNRWQGNIIRRVPSLVANKMMKIAFGDLGIHDTGCMVKVTKAEVLKSIRLYGELHRFMSYLLGMHGARMGELPVHHEKRTRGVSKYGFKRTLTVMFDILNVKFLTMKRSTPIQFMGPIALFTYLIGFLSTIYVIVDKIVSGADITGTPLFVIAILCFIMGTQFFSFGLLGELIIRSYFENGNKKSVYAIRKTY
jgi:glycosyltransferase involved in cell wall biosynthesis